mmetsp:Transcript_26458/g.30363  ORF Transcript_26458/g.30363 Transcript_26458/m.30363 type:complete len:126 (+) Transcript_26458:286-663(+)
MAPRFWFLLPAAPIGLIYLSWLQILEFVFVVAISISLMPWLMSAYNSQNGSSLSDSHLLDFDLNIGNDSKNRVTYRDILRPIVETVLLAYAHVVSTVFRIKRCLGISCGGRCCPRQWALKLSRSR